MLAAALAETVVDLFRFGSLPLFLLVCWLIHKIAEGERDAPAEVHEEKRPDAWSGFEKARRRHPAPRGGWSA